MQKRNGIEVEVVKMPQNMKKQLPAPRECATMSSCDFTHFLIGGLNYEAVKDISMA